MREYHVAVTGCDFEIPAQRTIRSEPYRRLRLLAMPGDRVIVHEGRVPGVGETSAGRYRQCFKNYI